MRYKSSLGYLFLSALCFLATGCANIWIPQYAEEAKPEVAVQTRTGETLTRTSLAPAPLQKGKQETLNSLEVLWRVPSEPVEKYYVYYGTEKSKLDKHFSVRVTELKRFDHPDQGPLFRFILPNVPLDKTVYVSLEAENAFGRSSMSQIVEIPPQAH